MSLRSVLAFFLVSTLAFSQNPAQSPTPDATVKVHTRLVVVDVVATDSHGAPVTDLGAGDFTLLENGREQKIATFVFQHPKPVTAPTPLPPNTFTNVPQEKSNTTNVILLDVLNGEFTSKAHALDDLRTYLSSLPEIPPTALYVLEKKLTLLHDFTTDPKTLNTALAGFKPPMVARVDTVYAAASPFTQRGDFQTSELNIQLTLQALNSLSQTLAGRPGRKNVIWISEAFPVNLFPDLGPMPTNARSGPSGGGGGKGGGGSNGSSRATMPDPGISPAMEGSSRFSSYSDYLKLILKVADALMGAQVAIYPIDAAGVGRISRVDAFTTMRTMAERTGGKVFVNQNDLTSSIRSSMDNGSTYYTLAYYPDDKDWDSRFRQITIRTSRSGVNLQYRLGYYALDPDSESKSNEDAKALSADFSRALGVDSPSSTAILFQARVEPAAGKEQKTMVRFEIDPHTLTYEEKADGTRHAQLGCAIAAYSDKGSLLKSEINNMVATIKPENFPRLMQTTFPCQCTIELKPGHYQLRLGVVDKRSKQIGTTTATVTVP